MFLIRIAFWLSIVILFIPANPETGAEAPRVGAFEALSAAQATVVDLSSFCDRNPAVCSTGSDAFQAFTEKARNGVRMLHDAFDGDEPDRGTLRGEDLEPAWQGDNPSIIGMAG